uniref:Uncharacterized protein n=1 Tax=Ditylenchus dipsaci TaxID=166011 RepID=A0A915EUF5_9BILA
MPVVSNARCTPPPMMCGCGCGRKKREAVEPHLKDMSTPCPQTQWKLVMEENMKETNAVNPANAIQGALYRRYSESKFLVTCSVNTTENSKLDLTSKLEISSGGDGYCNVVKQGVWCQAVSLSA